MAQDRDIVEGFVGNRVTGTRIVVAIDYGTSNTELAWAQTDGSEKNSLSDLGNDLIVFRDWPGKTAQTVPSVYSYSPTSDKRCSQWGWSIDNDSRVLKWTKLELEPQDTVTELAQLKELTKGLGLVRELRENEMVGLMNDVPEHIRKSAEDIVRDYLSKVSETWWHHMRQGQHTLESVPLDLVITHPATWKYEAMNKTYRAIMGAFPINKFPTLRNVSFASEPESGALYSVQDMLAKGHNILIPGECFVICDAGGGTVDLASYHVNKLEPLELTRVGNITGAKCGGTFVDQAFLKFLQSRLLNLDINPGDIGTGGHMIFKPKSKVLLERFEKIKHAFNGTGNGELTLPRGTSIAPGYEDSIVNGVLTLTEQDLKKMFSESVNGTLGLLSKQLTKIRSTRYKGIPARVTKIFMIGGFSESGYLFNEVTTFANRAADITVHRATDCWIGIVKGAVLRGMGIGMAAAPTVRSCPRNYGLCASYIYEEWNDLGEATVTNSFNGQRMVPDQIFWLVRHGDVILPLEPINTSLDIKCRITRERFKSGSSVRMIFVASAILEPPLTMANISRVENEVIYLDINPKKIPEQTLQKQSMAKGGFYLTADLKVVLNIADVVQVSVMHNGNLLSSIITNL